jgi:hypothetical protein
MGFEREDRHRLLRERAGEYVRVALESATKEHPVAVLFTAVDDRPYPTHRQAHPAFYGSFDWHSCVEMHWVAMRLLRMFPDETPGDWARATLNQLLTPEHLERELTFFHEPQNRLWERPYGWGWLLTLAYELATWDDDDARRWWTALEPLALHLEASLVEWLPKLTYPVRSGVHSNTAFSLSRSYDHALRRAEHGDRQFLDAINQTALGWFEQDTGYPAHYEPSGGDFLSAGLCEAELIGKILPQERFLAWLDRFLPGLAAGQPASIFHPATVTDVSDGHIAHLHGLNISRAWAMTALADRMPADDPRRAPLLASAERQANASLPQVSGSDYMVEHWLAVYAVLLLGS